MIKNHNTPLPEYLLKRYKIDYEDVEDLTEHEQIDGLWFMKRNLEELTGLRFVMETVVDNIPALYVYDDTKPEFYFQGEMIVSDFTLGDFFNQMDGLVTIAIAAHQKGKKQAIQDSTLFPT